MKNFEEFLVILAKYKGQMAKVLKGNVAIRHQNVNQSYSDLTDPTACPMCLLCIKECSKKAGNHQISLMGEILDLVPGLSGKIAAAADSHMDIIVDADIREIRKRMLETLGLPPDISLAA